MKSHREYASYGIWRGMIDRCTNAQSPVYKDYGGRGITVCARWLDSFGNFLADMGERPDAEYSLDRIDVNGPYCRENCRWATAKEQAGNRRNTIRLEINDNEQLLVDAASKAGTKYMTAYSRLRRGWTPEQAVSRPAFTGQNAITFNGETLTKARWAKRIGISRQALGLRLKAGWTIEQALTTPAKAIR